MITFDEAFAQVCAVAKPLGSERVHLEQAAGRVLASPVVARIDSPRADVSTMDGYAVGDADLARLPVRLQVIGEAFPGAPFLGEHQPHTCVRIFTGAPLPSGADRVVMQEQVVREGVVALFAQDLSSSPFIRRKASDFCAGDALLPAGYKLGPRGLVAAAAADVNAVEVFRRPRVAIIGTGDELRAPGTAAESLSAVPESTSVGLAALLEECGAELVDRMLIPDKLETMRSAANASLGLADVVVVTGGASVGERDFAKAMFDRLELIFSKVAIKPGKPVWLGRAGDRLVVGLPGNPTSALVTARLLLKPLMIGLAGGDPKKSLQWRRAPLATAMDRGSDRETFWRATTADQKVALIPNQDSGAQMTLAKADLLVRQLRGAPALPTGAEVEVIDF